MSLCRLNAVYILRKGEVFRKYSRIGHDSILRGFFDDKLSVVVTILGYVVIISTAMQVSFSVDRLKDNQLFVDMSLDFSMLSLVVLSVSAALACLGMIASKVMNWRAR